MNQTEQDDAVGLPEDHRDRTAATPRADGSESTERGQSGDSSSNLSPHQM